MSLLSGRRPPTLGVRDGKLSPCSWRPNCVCSQHPDDPHYIEPLRFAGDAHAAFAALASLARAGARTVTVTQRGDYLHLEAASAMFGFVDDVEFLLDEARSLIHVRSASRVGIGDFGVNRKRIESIRAQFTRGE